MSSSGDKRLSGQAPSPAAESVQDPSPSPEPVAASVAATAPTEADDLTETARERYLFIRILEACNADCFMCEYALSRNSYRFSVAEFRELLPKAVRAGVRYVRFTGGE